MPSSLLRTVKKKSVVLHKKHASTEKTEEKPAVTKLTESRPLSGPTQGGTNLPAQNASVNALEPSEQQEKSVPPLDEDEKKNVVKSPPKKKKKVRRSRLSLIEEESDEFIPKTNTSEKTVNPVKPTSLENRLESSYLLNTLPRKKVVSISPLPDEIIPRDDRNDFDTVEDTDRSESESETDSLMAERYSRRREARTRYPRHIDYAVSDDYSSLQSIQEESIFDYYLKDGDTFIKRMDSLGSLILRAFDGSESVTTDHDDDYSVASTVTSVSIVSADGTYPKKYAERNNSAWFAIVSTNEGSSQASQRTETSDSRRNTSLAEEIIEVVKIPCTREERALRLTEDTVEI